MRTSGFLPWIRFGDFRFPTYFFVISVVLTVVAFWVRLRAERLHVPIRQALDFFIVTLVFGSVGSRLLHIVWEAPSYYVDDPWRSFDFFSGGFVWYGGLIGGLIGFALVTRRPAVRATRSWRRWLDFFAPVAAFGYAGGRVACLLAGCCHGRECEWPFPHELPSQLFAILWESALGLVLLKTERKAYVEGHDLRPGGLATLWGLGHGLGRIAMELMRGDDRGPQLGPVTLSMGISTALVAFCAYLLIVKRTNRRRPPGP